MKLSEKLAALEQEEKPRGRRGRPAAAARRRASPSDPRRRPRQGRQHAGTPPRRRCASSCSTRSPRACRASPAEELAVEVKTALDSILQREDVEVTPLERRRFVQEMMSDTLGYGPLDPLLADDDHHRGHVQRLRRHLGGARRASSSAPTCRSPTTSSTAQVIDKIVSAVGRRVDEASPMVDARLPDGSRVNAIIPPLALHGSVLTIRKFSKDPYTAKDLINFGTWTLDLVTVMEACVRGKLNILVSGGTGTGKTTNLNVLSVVHPRRRAHHHHRGLGRAPAPAAARDQPRDPAAPTPRARARCRSATSSRTPSACGPTASSSASAVPPRPSTCSRP